MEYILPGDAGKERKSFFMMLYPPMASLIDKVGSSYLLVNVVARRAREISAKAEEEESVLDEKPVSTAINEVYSGRLEVEETDA